MLVYKVVGRKHRYGSNASIYLYKFGLDVFERMLDEYPQLKPYFPKYLKGSIVKSVESSIGILCFWDKKDAEQFRCSYAELSGEHTVIIEVDGIGYPTEPSVVMRGCGYIKTFLEKHPTMTEAPYGSVCFKAVEVLQ